jgi:hypothetical protein
MKMPPLFSWVVDHYHEQPVLTVVLALAAVALALYLLRKAIKVFVLLIVLLIAAIGVSYWMDGGAKTQQRLEEGGRRIGEAVRDSGVLGGEEEAAPEEAGG